MIKLENHQFSPYNVITDSDKDQDAEIVGSLGIEYLHKASSRRLLIMTKKKCLCRCGNPTIHLPKWSSSVLHWGHLEASHALCWDSEDTATCRNSIPTSLTWTELQGETGAYPECATLCSIQMVCTLSNLQNCFFKAPPGCAGLEASWGGQTFCLCGSRSVVFITCLAPVFLDIHLLPDWKHEPCSQGQIFIYKGFDCS